MTQRNEARKNMMAAGGAAAATANSIYQNSIYQSSVNSGGGKMQMIPLPPPAATGATSQVGSGGNQIYPVPPKPPPIESNAKWQEFRAGIQTGFGALGGGAANQERLLAQGPVANPLYGGRMNDARRNEVVSSIGRRIELIKKSNETRPNEADEESDPLRLRSKIQLFPHQRQALAWMLWRENQHPGGGILADDMGLGKTLTLISLILKSKELFDDDDDTKENATSSKETSKWLGKASKSGIYHSNGTLVVCPASLIGHWETEAKTRLKPGALDVLVYHGNNRQQTAKHKQQTTTMTRSKRHAEDMDQNAIWIGESGSHQN